MYLYIYMYGGIYNYINRLLLGHINHAFDKASLEMERGLASISEAELINTDFSPYPKPQTRKG